MSGGEGGLGQILPTGTITFLLTDIEGSTRKWLEYSSVMGGAVERHNGILVSAVEAHQGHDLEKKSEGDGRFFVFNSARDALLGAIDIQQALAREDWGAVGPIKVRIALHSGEAELRNNDYFGPVVNRCARMRGAAHGGQIILSEATKELIGERLPLEVTLRDLGLHRFKDLQEPDRIYQAITPDIEDIRTPLNSLSAAKNNLPIQLSSFVGRVEQLEKIRKLILSNRLVTLVGVGGGGKTRLALHVAADVVEEFPDGVWFVDLGPIQDPALILQAIAQSLPIAVQGRLPMDAIVDNYSDARALFIIDNCEHLAENAAQIVNDLLHRCSTLKVLATSRGPLAIRGETIFNVPPMDFDLHGKPAIKDIVAQLEAVELLRDRAAKRLSGEDILTDETAEDIVAICKMLDGIPLALEQVAANLAFMSVREARNQLFDILKLDEVGVTDRQKTMEAAIDWSYTLLKQDEQELFLLLSIFDGGWTRDAAEFVCEESVPNSSKIARVLDLLAKGSLVVFWRQEGLMTSRYRMLEPIRQYAGNHLSPHHVSTLRQRHFEWYYHLAQNAKAAGLNADDGRYLKLLSLDYDNVRKALAWGPTQQDLAPKTVELCNSLYEFWLRRGLIREGTTWFQQAMNASPDLPEEIRAEALLWLGILQWQGGNLEAAEKAIRASYETFKALGDQANTARALANLGNLTSLQGRFDEARLVYLEVIPIFEKFGNLKNLAQTLENLGVCESHLGRLEDATKHLERAVDMHRQQNAPSSMAKALDGLLGVYTMQGVLLEHTKEFLEASEIALGEEQNNFLFENLLEVGCSICMALSEYELAAQAFGAMELAVEQSQRIVLPVQITGRDALRTDSIKRLGLKGFQRADRDGRALGPGSMLGLVCRRVEGEG